MRGRIVAGAVGLGCAGLTVLAMLIFVPTAGAVPKAPAVPKVTVGPKTPAGQCGGPDCGSGGRTCGSPDCGSSGRTCGSPDCGSSGRTCGSPDCGSSGYEDRGSGGPGYGGAADRNGDVMADCRDAIDNASPGGSGGLKLTANVPDRATVAPGQDVTVRLTWNPKDWSGKDLDMALACVRVKGGLDSKMSNEERPSANDGSYEYRLHVPDNIKPGCDICVQGFLAGATGDGGSEQVGSNEQCFMSGSPAPPAKPTPPATQPPSAQPPTARAPYTQTPPRTPAEVPAEVAASNVARPAPAPAGPVVAPDGELPRTGASASRVGTAAGGLTLALGGFALIGGAGRRSRGRPTG
jgi:LPXTG cell wall anchor motif